MQKIMVNFYKLPIIFCMFKWLLGYTGHLKTDRLVTTVFFLP